MNQKQLKLSDLIALADRKKSRQREQKHLYVKSLDGIITVEKPDRALCVDALDMEDGDAYLVLECVVEPNLKESELLQAYGCVEPLEVVEKIFDPGEISLISQELVKMAGYGDDIVKVVDDLKN